VSNQPSITDWISSLGTLIAVLGLLREVALGRRDRRKGLAASRAAAILDDTRRVESQVVRVTGWLEFHRTETGFSNVTAVIGNSSESAIFSVRCFLDLGTPGEIEPQEIAVVAPGSHTAARAWLAVELSPMASANDLSFTFVDAEGRSWRRHAAQFEQVNAIDCDADLDSALAPKSREIAGEG
jgi:hypothetical protein